MLNKLDSADVELTDFTKSFRKRNSEIKACDGINFFAKEKSITGLLGPNGAGKSTLLKTVCGALYATSGTVKICGETEPFEIRHITSFVPESPELDESFTVKEYLYYESGMNLCSVENAMDLCSLHEVKNRTIKTLSKGYKQRVSLASGICKNPKVLVLDEFSAGLDPAQTVMMRNNLKKLSKTTTIIFSTHSIEEALSLCDRIYILGNGCVKAFGTEEEICRKLNSKNLEEAYLKCTGEEK